MGPPTDQTTQSDRATRFVAGLEGLVKREDRAALAALRRGLGKAPGEAAEMCRYVDPWLPSSPKPWEDSAYYLVASLFGLHPTPWPGGGHDAWKTNLGASFATLAGERGQERVERRFVALLNSDREDLPSHLRHCIGLLRTDDVPVDWVQLLRDVQRWDAPGGRVHRQWANAFWGQGATEGSSDSAPADA